jgi:hydroxymethylpyrimidine pyrophosphatase-like HAD family hydrolase
MRYLALATDYDGTLATSGTVASETFGALDRFRASGRRVIMLTGRRVEDLRSICPRLDLFDCVVAENGAVLYSPESQETVALSQPPPPDFTEALHRHGVTPLVTGHVVVATNHPHETSVVQVIHEQGLELQIIFNGNSVMVLPPGVNKGSGLVKALQRLDLSPHEIVGIGNAANDHSFLELCECAVAVQNAVPAIKAKASFCTTSAAGAGVVELIDEIIRTDLADRSPLGIGGGLVLGTREDGTAATFEPYGRNLLIAGPSASGKSTFATGLIERLIERSYQLCIIDPEGDYGTLDDILTLGSRLRAPRVEEILDVLADPEANVIVNLLGIPLSDRPEFFLELLPHLHAMRARTARPHWILVDEVHHLLPSTWGLVPSMLPQRSGETILITVHPSQVAGPILRLVDIAVAVGRSPAATLEEFARAVGDVAPDTPEMSERRDEVVAWFRTAGIAPFRLRVVPARAERLRHLRKYAEGNLGPKSFFFRGPHGRLNLRAQNLVAFCDLAAGVDDETWLFHLRGRHYSEWLRRAVKDEDLAREVGSIEQALDLTAGRSRRLVHDAIDRRYTLPA